VILITEVIILHYCHVRKLSIEHFVNSFKQYGIFSIVRYDESVIIKYFKIVKRGVSVMAKTELGNKTNTPIKHEDESELKGTLVSVFLVALVLIGTWAGVYFMYVARL
jgi:hypothetical protein